MSSDQRLMKDGLGLAAVERIARNLRRAWPAFAEAEFVADASQGLKSLELKQRVHHVIGRMADHLPNGFEPSLKVVLGAARIWDRGSADDPLNGFAAWPLIDFVGVYGLKHPAVSLKALKKLTPLFSAEFAIRPFLKTHQALTLKTIAGWTDDGNEHVRRLVSEGTRPRLPWGERLPAFVQNPTPVFGLLQKLRNDGSEYVRRSVANNLNDISKDHPERVIDTCTRWRHGAGKDRMWIIRHATRGLVKSRHPEVWGLLGYTDRAQLSLKRFRLSPKSIELGDVLHISAEIQSETDETQRLVVDYAVHHVKANGQTSPKVFKLNTLELKPGESAELSKRHPIRPITTRRYYPGRHFVEIFINGGSIGKRSFTLTGV